MVEYFVNVSLKIRIIGFNNAKKDKCIIIETFVQSVNTLPHFICYEEGYQLNLLWITLSILFEGFRNPYIWTSSMGNDLNLGSGLTGG